MNGAWKRVALVALSLLLFVYVADLQSCMRNGQGLRRSQNLSEWVSISKIVESIVRSTKVADRCIG
ncbi:hypothetical protein BDM02DRAFT_3113116 [Thelephora ganbajun]|uniref:Uncharacterized protein n=1 Tax=Thelephora ganbajun TaxID=370292 RepID=A0ACB6ZJT7_THEGA|nr:hypothetical protein BDM02DRAFT_3113116 [Thelephora ganbajun]